MLPKLLAEGQIHKSLYAPKSSINNGDYQGDSDIPCKYTSQIFRCSETFKGSNHSIAILVNRDNQNLGSYVRHLVSVFCKFRVAISQNLEFGVNASHPPFQTQNRV